MASKKVEFHEDAASEYEAALEWYLERSVLAASKFVDAISRGMDMIVEAPRRGQSRHSKISSSTVSVCNRLSRTSGGNSGAGDRPRSPQTRLLEATPLS